MSRVVGSAGRHDQFDDACMPLQGASPERWKRTDRVYRSGADLPPVSLYKMDDDYFVQDGHHRVSVARFYSAEWIDAYVTEFRSSRRPGKTESGRHNRRDRPGTVDAALGAASCRPQGPETDSISSPPRRNSYGTRRTAVS